MQLIHTSPALRGGLAAAVLALLAALPARPQTATLVRDLNPEAWTSAPPSASGLLAAGGKLFFASDGPAVADADGSGSTLLADLCPDCFDPVFLGSLGNTVLFAAKPASSGDPTVALYRSDGTRAGTFSLGVSMGAAGSWAFAGDLFFFLNCDPIAGCQPWKTDGTLAGTRQIKDLSTGSRFPRVETLTAVGRRVFFFDLEGDDLWVSDGTAAGTTRIRAGLPSPLQQAGGSSRFYFLVETGGDISTPVAHELWASDGTAAGTQQLTHFGSGGAVDNTFQVRGDSAYLVAAGASPGRELWASDGTPAGTHPVTDFGNSEAFQRAEIYGLLLVKLGDRLVFLVSDGFSNHQLWTSTGTPESTAPLGTVVPMGQFVPVAGGRAVFRAAQGTHETELWSTDGTPQGTRRLPLPCTGCSLLGQADPLPLQGLAYFLLGGPQGVFLGTTDGTPEGTRHFGDPVHGIALGEVARVASRLFFTLSTGDSGYPLLTSDGRPGGTRPVPGLHSGGSSNPFDLRPQAGQLVFTACDGQSRQIWRTAGTSASTEPLTAFRSALPLCSEDEQPVGLTATASRIFFLRDQGLWSLSPSGEPVLLAQVDFSLFSVPKLVQLGERVYFFARPDNGNGVQLWHSDGTAAGTGPATEVAAVPGLAAIDRLGGTLYLRGASAEGGELWASDGTAAGTRQLLVVKGDSPIPFAQAGPWAYFFTQAGLWRTDGTAAGTAFVADPYPTPFLHSLQPADPVDYGGTLYFFADTSGRRGLFRSDGTAAGTGLVREFSPELDALLQPASNDPAVLGGRLFFLADDGVHGRELWASDGTAAGTTLVADVNPGPDSSRAAELTVAGGRLYFSAYDPVHGAELWQSDGTASGTRLAADLAPESASSNPRHLTAVGDRLYFAADDGISGNELWTLDAAAPDACQPGDTRLCLAGGRFQVEVAWKDFQGNTGVGHAAPLTADTGTFWFFNAENVELAVKVLDARSLNEAFWIFYGALSSVDYTITVTDTQTGLSRRYHNPSGQLASVGDTQGFGPLGAFDTKAFETPAPTVPRVTARSVARAATGCVPAPGRLCLQSGRFAVTAAWKDFQGHTGTGTAVALTGDTGYFWFFGPGNVEVLTKVLDGRGLNGKFWLFYGALSNVEYTLTVTDTQTGVVKTYKNPSGQFGSVADTGAF